MTPPVKPCCSRNSRTMPRRRARSSRDSILRDTPTWSTVGMNTRNRPGIVACEVSRAPLVPSGSLTTWTRTSWPSFSRSSIFGCGTIAVAVAVRPGRGARGRSPGRRRPAAPPRPRRRPATATGPAAAGSAGSASSSSPGLEALEFLDGVDDLRDVEERVALEPDVDEGRLHPGQDFRDPALVDVADHAALMLALDEDLDDLVVLEDGDPRFVVARGDDHLLVHGTHSTRPGGRGADRRRPAADESASRADEARQDCDRTRPEQHVRHVTGDRPGTLNW